MSTYKERNIGESKISTQPKKRLGLIIDNGVIQPRHFSEAVETDYLVPLIEDVISYHGGSGGSTAVPYISIDSLNIATDGTTAVPGIYVVTNQIGGNAQKVGILQVVVGENKVTQLLTTHYVINDSGVLTDVMSAGVNQYCRDYASSSWGIWSKYNFADDKQDALNNASGILTLVDTADGPKMVLKNAADNTVTTIATSNNAWNIYGNTDIVIPTIGSVEAQGYLVSADIAGKADSSSLASVATSGSYSDLSDKPSIPTKTSDITNDSGYITGTDYYTKAEVDEKIVDVSTGGTVDLSNYYNKQQVDAMIPEVPTNVSSFTNDAGYITTASIDGKANKVVTRGGNFAELDSSGDLADSGVSKFDFQEKLYDGGVVKLYENGTMPYIGLVTGNHEEVRGVITSLDTGDGDRYIPTVGAITRQNYVTSSTLSNYATKSELPTALADLTSDSTHRTVTDEERSTWSSHTSNIGTVTAIKLNNTSYQPNSAGLVDLGTSAIDDNAVVHKASEETISGKKTFTNALIINSANSGCIKSYNETGFGWIQDSTGSTTLQTVLNNKQNVLKDVTTVGAAQANIKTINNQSILGTGNLNVAANTDACVHKEGTEIITGNKEFAGRTNFTGNCTISNDLTMATDDPRYPTKILNADVEGFGWIIDSQGITLKMVLDEMQETITSLVSRVRELEQNQLNYSFDQSTSTLTFSEPE